MPKLVVAVPQYRQHKRGNAIVRIGGRDIYLGRFNSPESKAKYHHIIAEWEANGRTLRPIVLAPGETVTCEYIRSPRRQVGGSNPPAPSECISFTSCV